MVSLAAAWAGRPSPASRAAARNRAATFAPFFFLRSSTTAAATIAMTATTAAVTPTANPAAPPSADPEKFSGAPTRRPVRVWLSPEGISGRGIRHGTLLRCSQPLRIAVSKCGGADIPFISAVFHNDRVLNLFSGLVLLLVCLDGDSDPIGGNAVGCSLGLGLRGEQQQGGH